MSTSAIGHRVARLEQRRAAGSEGADLDTLRMLAALRDAEERGDDGGAAELQERLRHRPAPRPGGFLEALAQFGAEYAPGGRHER